MNRWWPPLILLLLLWATRLIALENLPIHNDEGLHLTRAIEVWNGHPFWVISDGKIVNHWLIAAFYPQHAPVFVSRFATIVISLLGLAAAYALVRRWSPMGALLAGALWIGTPYLFFYERLAFSDVQAGALAVVAFWLALRKPSAISFQPIANSRQSSVVSRQDAADTRFAKDFPLSIFPLALFALPIGLALAAAALFKFTAVPFALSIALLVLAQRRPLRQRLTLLVIIGLTVAACFAVPLAYLALRGQDFFSIALGWIGTSSGGSPALLTNLERLWSQLTGFGSVTWVILLAAGWLFLLLTGLRRRGLLIIAAAGVLPLVIILVLGREVLSRHFVVVLPILVTLGGAGLGFGLERIRERQARAMAAALGMVALVFGSTSFWLTAYGQPADLPLPPDARYEHITSHSSGYGLREAVQALPQTLLRSDVPVIASMFPDSCRRTNFYAIGSLRLICVDAPGLTEIEAALNQYGAVYVLADNAPRIGVDVTTLGVYASQVAVYPRPGETESSASLVLWLLLRDAAALDCEGNQALAAYTPASSAPFISLRDGQFYAGDDRFLVRGVNYYPARYPWRRFLTEADTASITRELNLLQYAGLNTLRLFLWNEALFKCPTQNATPIAAAFERLDAIIHLAAERGFRLIITLNDLPDLTRIPLYDNPSYLQQQTRFIIERYRDEAAILAWDLRNEGDIDYGSLGTVKVERERVLNWLATTADQVRALDNNHLITAGWLHDSQATASAVDFISFHHWEDAASMRKRLADIRAATDKPILLQEYGFSTFRLTPDEQATQLLEVAQAAEAEGLLGWLIWTAFDFPLDATCTPPACPSVDNAEHHFGLWTSEYFPKSVVERLASAGMLSR